MKEDSPQLKSPLISASHDERLDVAAAAAVNGIESMVSGSASSRASPARHCGMWKLTYKDFLPSRKVAPGHKHKFSDLIHKANDWLKKNGDVRLKSCEVVTWMDKDERRLGDSEVMVMSRKMADNVNTYHLRGLRLWLAPESRSSDVTHQRKVCHCDIVPDKSDTIKSLLDKVNRKIDDFQLKGKTLGVQTLWFPVIHNKIESDLVKWTESSTYNSHRAFILRVFYTEEDGNKENIVFQDFLPQATGTGQYEGFDQLVESANTWVTDQKDLTLLNMQSVLVQKQQGSAAETGNECFFVIPGVLDDSVPTEFFRILRVAYSKTKPGKGLDGQALCPLAYETFTPQMMVVHEGKTSSKRERVERMKDVFRRVETFLEHNDCEIVNAETVMNPMQVIPSTEEGNLQPQEIKWLFTVRLYLTNQTVPIVLEEPRFQRTGSARGSFRHSSRRKKNDEDAEHPGPIFLRNVVNRRYRYRWVLVAVVAFVTMSLIVALSVVYSYKT